MQDMRSRHEIKLIVLLIILIAIVFTFWGVLFNIFNEDDNLENKLVFPINSKIKQITLETPKSNSDWNYTICYTNGEWKYRNSIVLSQVAAYSIAETVKNTSASRVIPSDELNLGRISLIEPKYILNIVSDDEIYKLYIGEYNSILDEYYCMMEDDKDSVYLVSSYQISKEIKCILDLIDAPSVVKQDASLLEMLKISNDIDKENFEGKKDSESFKFLIDNKTYNVDVNRVKDVFYAIKNVSFIERCIAYDSKNYELSEFGLDNPVLEISLTFKNESNSQSKYVISIGEGEENNVYIKTNESDYIYLLKDTDYMTLLEKVSKVNFMN